MGFDKPFFKKNKPDFAPYKPLDICAYLIKMGRCGNVFDAKKLIDTGKVFISETKCVNSNTKIQKDDEVVVDGERVSFVKPKIYLMYKDRGVSMKKSTASGERSVYSFMPSRHADLIAVGGVDLNTQGLILFTNHPKVAKTLNSPLAGIKKVYKLKISKAISEAETKDFCESIVVSFDKDFTLSSEKLNVRIDSIGDSFSFITVICYSASVMEIRRVFFEKGINVLSITRVAYGDFKLTKDIKDSGCLMEDKNPVFTRKFEENIQKKLNEIRGVSDDFIKHEKNDRFYKKTDFVKKTDEESRENTDGDQ